jgi:hypothetical protein
MTEHSREGAFHDKVLKMKCPVCGANAVYSAKNLFRPFCSEGCHNRDLAAWASDQYHVPGQQMDPETLHEGSRRSDDREDDYNF